MNSEANKAAKLRYFEGFNRKDLSVFDELFGPDYVLHAAGSPDVVGPQVLKSMVSQTFSGLSDINLVAEDMLAEGDRVATRWTLTAIHTGVFMGIQPTNNKIRISGIIIDRFKGGKSVEAWEVYDSHSLVHQLESTSTE